MTSDLRFDGVSRDFGRQRALSELDLRCPSGMTCLVGPNGAGKSTALALAAGLLAPTRGRIVVGDREIRLATPAAATGYLPQHSAYHPLLTVGEVLDFTRAARDATDDALRQVLAVTGLEQVRERPIGELSGGWVRRLGLLSALLGAPRLLLLDEPFVGLDPETHDRLVAHLRSRLDDGVVIVLASHDFDSLDLFRPRVAVFEEGRLRALEERTGNGTGSSRAIYRQELGTTPLRAVGDSR